LIFQHLFVKQYIKACRIILVTKDYLTSLSNYNGFNQEARVLVFELRMGHHLSYIAVGNN